MAFEDLTERELVACTIVGEARGEPIEGQIAVGCVIRNRTSPAKTYRQVVEAPFQFSCWNPGDPNRTFLFELVQVYRAGTTPKMLAQALWIADGIMVGSCQDNTVGATHYLTKSLFLSNPPKWAKARVGAVTMIGTHVFMKLAE